MRIFAVANQKGGVGKTTTTVTLGGLIRAEGGRVLLVDVDPHGSLTAYFGFDPETVKQGVYGLFQQAVAGETPDASPLIRKTLIDGLDILPANTALATLDRQLGSRSGMGLVVARGLKRVAPRYDAILLDCPPMLGVLMVNALASADRLLIPVQTEFLALRGLDRMINTLRMVQRSRQAELRYLIVPTLFDRRTRAAHEALTALRGTHGIQVWRDVIPIDTKFRDASSAGQPLNYLAPDSRGVIAYTALLRDLGWRRDAQNQNESTANTVTTATVKSLSREDLTDKRSTADRVSMNPSTDRASGPSPSQRSTTTSAGARVIAFDPDRPRTLPRSGSGGGV